MPTRERRRTTKPRSLLLTALLPGVFTLLFTWTASPAVAPADSRAAGAGERAPVRVVGSLPDYAYLAEQIGGGAVSARYICQGNQDPHFVRPKPSFAVMLRDADLFVTTGLDLELWVPTVLDKAGNRRVMEGGSGYVAAAPGVPLLEVPSAGVSRSEGDIHVHGNPHINTDPLNMIFIGRNILAGLKRVDPESAALYEENAAAFEDRIHRRMFGDWLVDRMGGDTLARLARSGKLMTFLEEKEFQGERLIGRLGGWLGRAAPLRGQKIICYHKSWNYLAGRFGLKIAGYVETKPGIPPTPQHVREITRMIKEQGIAVILTAGYFDPAKPQTIADRTGARVVHVPLLTGGAPGLETYEALVDHWLDSLLEAFGAHEEKSRG